MLRNSGFRDLGIEELGDLEGKFDSPDNRHIIFPELWIGRENWQFFHLSLGYQYAIKRILVVNRQS